MEPVEERIPLRMGSAFSDALEHWDISAIDDRYAIAMMDAGNSDHVVEEKAKVQVMATAYMERYDQPEQREVDFEREVNGYEDKGRFDGVNTSDGIELIEDKFKGRWGHADSTAVASCDEQATAYIVNASIKFKVAIEDVRMLYRATIKPQHKYNSSKETVAEYKHRVAQVVAKNPERFFHQVPVARTNHQAAEWQAELEETIAYLEWLKDRGTWRRHTHACGDYGGCEMLGPSGLHNQAGIEDAKKLQHRDRQHDGERHDRRRDGA
jgi:hypothetical protein